MSTEKFNDAKPATGEWLDKIAALPDRRQSSPSVTAPQLTIAQSIRRSSDPHHAAVTSFTRRDVPPGQNKHTYYFEDGSFLTFEVTYTAIEDGGRE